jgi:uncharacterized membrane-anchored protein
MLSEEAAYDVPRPADGAPTGPAAFGLRETAAPRGDTVSDTPVPDVTTPRTPAVTALIKVQPTITLLFWIAKLATTAFGEAFSDYVFFNDYLTQGVAMLIGLGLLAICLVLQFRARTYRPVVYWLAVTAVSIFGTMSADFLNKDLGMPFWASTALLLVLQSAVFVVWYRSQRTLSIHSIDSRPRESFYWLTVVFTFALGTAMGDFVSTTLGFGTAASTVIFLVVIAVPVVAWRWLRLNSVIAFWFAYSVTRPLGASFADWLGVPAPYGDGIQWGTGVASIIFGVLLVAVIAIIALRYRRESRRADSPSDAAG